MKRSNQIILFFILVILLCFVVVPFSSNPLYCSFYLIVATSLLTYIFNLVTKEYSWTDRLWSTLPVYIGFLYFIKTRNTIILICAILIALWGARLSYNFTRRGGFTSKEDYRWSILRKKLGTGFVWQLFSILFIAFYQQFLFVAFTAPLGVIKEEKPTLISYIFMVTALGFLVVETIADQQQWVFQEAKHHKRPREKKFEEEYKTGFRTSGLFKISRHPNYFGELGFWWSIYFICSLNSEQVLNFTFIGPVLLSLLFVGSVNFTEKISQAEYPKYQQYTKEVSAVVPLVWKRFK